MEPVVDDRRVAVANLEDRIALLEQKLEALTQRVRANEQLAAAHEVPQLKTVLTTQTAMLQSVYERQGEHTEQLALLGDGQTSLESGLNLVMGMLSPNPPSNREQSETER